MAAQNYDNLNKIGIEFQGKGISFFLKIIQLDNFSFSKNRYQKPQKLNVQNKSEKKNTILTHLKNCPSCLYESQPAGFEPAREDHI